MSPHFPLVAILVAVLILPAKRADIRLPGIGVPTSSTPSPPQKARRKQ